MKTTTEGYHWFIHQHLYCGWRQNFLLQMKLWLISNLKLLFLFTAVLRFTLRTAWEEPAPPPEPQSSSKSPILKIRLTLKRSIRYLRLLHTLRSWSFLFLSFLKLIRSVKTIHWWLSLTVNVCSWLPCSRCEMASDWMPQMLPSNRFSLVQTKYKSLISNYLSSCSADRISPDGFTG